MNNYGARLTRLARVDPVLQPALSRLILLALAMLVGGCSSLNPMDLIRPDTRPKMAVLPELKASVATKLLWQANVGTSGNMAFNPMIVADAAFAAARDGTVARFSASNGQPGWRINVGAQLSGGVGADATLVAVGSSEGEVIGIEAGTGKIRWRANVSSEVLAAPVVAGDIVVVRAADSRIFALDVVDGRRRWVYQRAIPSLTVRSNAGVVVRENVAFVGFAGGRLAAIALGNGGLRWESAVAQPKGATELERVADVVGIPWVAEREVCAVAYQGRVACFDATNGQSLWARNMSSTNGLNADARYVFVTDDKG
ncbi:MAG: outer membrane protein assembly factor BamB, partial [Burkholderiales bacterium]